MPQPTTLKPTIRYGELSYVLSVAGVPFQSYSSRAAALCEYVRAKEMQS